MTTAVSFEVIDQAVEQARPTMERLASELWRLAELSLQEVQSARLLMACLQEAGFTITSQGTASVPTAFVAEWGNERPFLGILVEYDALPGLGNEAVPQKTPREDQVASGHGCGHNLLRVRRHRGGHRAETADGRASPAWHAARLWLRRRRD